MGYDIVSAGFNDYDRFVYMRELKFKVWDTKFLTMSGGFDIKEMPSIAAAILAHKHGELLQFTGLYDKNGVGEIYFKDVVEYETTEGTIHRALVNWSVELCCVMIGIMPYPQLYQSAFIQPSKIEFTILGNIYQNPELL